MTFIPNPDFSEFEVLARPCPTRESRVFYRPDGRGGQNGTDYGPYSLALAKGDYGVRGGLVILIEHGAGREALAIHSIYAAQDIKMWLLSLPEQAQYAALWDLYKTAADVRDTAQRETANRYAQAFVDGRLKKRRKNNRVYVEFAQPVVAATALGVAEGHVHG